MSQRMTHKYAVAATVIISHSAIFSIYTLRKTANEVVDKIIAYFGRWILLWCTVADKDLLL